MNPTDLEKLVKEGESDTVELKNSTASPDVISRAVCAFLNQHGGRVVIGVEDRRVVGVKDAEAFGQRIENHLNSVISPSALWTVEHVAVGDSVVVVVDVPEGLDKPYVAAGSIYFRRGAQVVAATRDEISQLISSRAQASLRWERQIALGVDLSDLDKQLLGETARRALESQRWQGSPDDLESFLSSHGLASYGGITNAGLLLFGKQPTRILPQARVRLVVMPEGKTGGFYKDDRMFEGSLLNIAREIPAVLETQAGVVSTFSNVSWERQSLPGYPSTALREGVINALVHRDYSVTGLITISVLPDSLQISNPGGLPEGLTTADLKRDHLSIARNPDIAYMFFLNGLIEIVGRGTQRIVEDFREAGTKEPQWQSSRLETRLTLFAPHLSVKTEELTPRQRQILTLLEDRKETQSGDLATLLGGDVTDRTVRNDLQQLVKRGLVVKLGQGRSTSYVLKTRDTKSGR